MHGTDGCNGSQQPGCTFECAICHSPHIPERANVWPLTLAARALGHRPYSKRSTPIRQLAPPWRVSHVHTRTKLTRHTRSLVDLNPIRQLPPPWSASHMHARTKLTRHTRTLVDLDPLATRQQNVRWLNEAMVPWPQDNKMCAGSTRPWPQRWHLT